MVQMAMQRILNSGERTFFSTKSFSTSTARQCHDRENDSVKHGAVVDDGEVKSEVRGEVVGNGVGWMTRPVLILWGNGVKQIWALPMLVRSMFKMKVVSKTQGIR